MIKTIKDAEQEGVLENRAKIDIPQVEWNKIKSNINYYL
jgi:hypothetical protein